MTRDIESSPLFQKIVRNTIYDPVLMRRSVPFKYMPITQARIAQIKEFIASDRVAAVAPFIVFSEISLLHLYLFEKIGELIEVDVPVSLFLQNTDEQDEQFSSSVGKVLTVLNKMEIYSYATHNVHMESSDEFTASMDDNAALQDFESVFSPLVQSDGLASFRQVYLSVLYADQKDIPFIVVGQNQANLYESMISFVGVRVNRPLAVVPLYLPMLPFTSGKIPYVGESAESIGQKIGSLISAIPNATEQLDFAIQIYRYFIFREAEDVEDRLDQQLRKLAGSGDEDTLISTVVADLYSYLRHRRPW